MIENMTEEFTGTTKELAERMGCDYATAGMVLKFLVAKGIAKEAGVRTGTGKPSNLFTIPITPITLTLVK